MSKKKIDKSADKSETKQRHFSISQLLTYQKCPLHYYFRYIKGKKIPPRSPMTVGSSVHSALEHNFKQKIKSHKDLKTIDLLNVYSDSFDLARPDTLWKKDEKPGKIKDDGLNLVRAYHTGKDSQGNPMFYRTLNQQTRKYEVKPVKPLSPTIQPIMVEEGKGTHLGVKQLQTFTRKVYQTHQQCFVLKCDIKKFFPTIDHKILFNIIAERIKDNDVLWLVKMIIESFSSEFSDIDKKGAPIGNLTSQLFANVYMNEFDQYIKHNLKVKYYIRYTDDFVIIHHNQDYLFEIKEKIDDFLKDKLKLSLHPGKVSVRKYTQGVDFLGYVSLYKASVLRAKTKHRIFKKLKERTQKFRDGMITEKTLLQSFNSYLGVLSHADCYGLEQKLRHKFWEWLKEPKAQQKGTADLLPTLAETPKGSNCGGATAPLNPQLD